ncbi:hypothetical protein LOD99_208 [Oopsacas minuta]|uniref:Nucleoporin NUP53 n=1 Tax=Oopsacas minuta TaxID=111878 RepID=A0AAV7K8Q8_9METZ|nr:hypothetical protein LOD99_208 [Oopsacas minuta]
MFPEARHHSSTATPTSQTNYLPAYLLGGGSSPSILSPSLSSSQQSPLRQSHLVSSSHNLPKPESTNSMLKQDGPPVASLYENQTCQYSTLEKKKVFQESYTNQSLTQTSLLGVNTSLDQSITLNLSAGLNSLPPSVLSPAQMDPFYTQGEELTPEDTLDQCWVTIFGFPPNSVSFILDQFSQYGTILHHVTVPGSNWLHLKYHTSLQAKKALSKNGRVFGSCIMVGVQQCIDKAVMGSYTGDSQVIRGTPMRPLTSNYKVPIGDSSLSQANTPQKNTGIVSKALEYVFGW